MHSFWRGTFLLPWMAAFCLFIWLILIRIPLDGVRELHFLLDGRNPWFDAFLPGERASSIGLQPEGWIGQRVFKQPVYAGVRLPGVYRHLSLGLEFKPQFLPLLDIGFRQEPGGGDAFSMRPLWSAALAQGWKRVVWQDREGYVRLGEEPQALADPNLEHLLVWHASTTVPAWMDTERRERVFPVALRGSHELRAVPVQGTIQFRLDLQDMNRHRERGTVVFSLSQSGRLLWSEALSLAGARDHRPSSVYTKEIDIRDLSAGVYTLSMTADDDIFVRQIRSPLRHWVIGPRLYFADQIGYATSSFSGLVWTNAHHIVAKTFHVEGLQELSLGSSKVVLTAVQKEYSLDRQVRERQGTQVLKVPRGDVRLIADGYFALAPDLLFLPTPRRLRDASDLDAEGIRAVLTPYVAPHSLGDGWYESANGYPLESRPGTVRLAIDAPGIEERGGFLDVRAAHVIYRRETLSWRDWWRVAYREIAVAWHAL